MNTTVLLAVMLRIFRRHRKRCEHRMEGRAYRRCQCPVWVDGHIDGEEIHRSLRTRDWEKAQRIVREWEADGQYIVKTNESGPVTLARAWHSFLADMDARHLQDSTVRKYRLLSRQMQEFAARRGMRFVRQIDLPTLRDFRAGWKDGPLSSTKKLERLRSFYHFAQESEWVEGNPASKVKSPKSPQRPTLPFTHEEMVRILAALAPYVDEVAPSGKNSALRLRALAGR